MSIAACDEIYEAQKSALKKVVENNGTENNKK